MLGQALAIFIGVCLAVLPGPGRAQEPADAGDGPFASEKSYFEAVLAHSAYIRPDQTIGLIRGVRLLVEDQVSGGCWTNARRIRASLRLELERAGIAVYEEDLAYNSVFSPVLHVEVYGHANGGVCIGGANMQVFAEVVERRGSLSQTGKVFNIGGTIVLWRSNALYSTGGILNAQLLDWAETGVETLIADILKARREESVAALLAVWPDEPPMTRAEFETKMGYDAK